MVKCYSVHLLRQIIFTYREFTYEAGNKCDPNQVDEDELEEELRPRNPPPKKPINSGAVRPQQAQPQIQYRPQLAQY